MTLGHPYILGLFIFISTSLQNFKSIGYCFCITFSCRHQKHLHLILKSGDSDSSIIVSILNVIVILIIIITRHRPDQIENIQARDFKYKQTPPFTIWQFYSTLAPSRDAPSTRLSRLTHQQQSLPFLTHPKPAFYSICPTLESGPAASLIAHPALNHPLARPSTPKFRQRTRRCPHPNIASVILSGHVRELRSFCLSCCQTVNGVAGFLSRNCFVEWEVREFLKVGRVNANLRFWLVQFMKLYWFRMQLPII